MGRGVVSDVIIIYHPSKVYGSQSGHHTRVCIYTHTLLTLQVPELFDFHIVHKVVTLGCSSNSPYIKHTYSYLYQGRCACP